MVMVTNNEFIFWLLGADFTGSTSMNLIGCSPAISVVRESLPRFPMAQCVILCVVVSSCCLANSYVLADAADTPEERLQSLEKALVEGECRTSRATAAARILRISKEDQDLARKSQEFPSIVLTLTWHELINDVDNTMEDGSKPNVLGSRLQSWGKVIREQLQVEPPATWLWYCKESHLWLGVLRGPLADYSSKVETLSTTERPGVSWIEDPVEDGELVAAGIRRAVCDGKTEVVRLPKDVIAELLGDGGFNSTNNVSAAIRDDQLFILIPTFRNAFPIGHELYCLRILNGRDKQLFIAETVWHKSVCNAWDRSAWPNGGGRVMVVTELRIGADDVFVFSAFPGTVSIESLSIKDGGPRVAFSHLLEQYSIDLRHRKETLPSHGQVHDSETNSDTPVEKAATNGSHHQRCPGKRPGIPCGSGGW
jgi:hypothetical protein